MASAATAPIAAALALTREAGTARLRASTQPGGPLPAPSDFRLEGVADLRARTTLVRERMLSREAADSLRASAGRASRIAATLAAVGEAEAELLFVAGTRYLLGPGDRWTATSAATGPDGPRHPEDPLWLLDGIGGPLTVQRRRPDRVGALEVTCHVGTLDLRAASAWFGARLAGTPRATDALLRRGRSRWAHAVPFAVWVDEAGLLRRLSYATAEPPGGSALWWTTELWDHGCPVRLPQIPAR